MKRKQQSILVLLTILTIVNIFFTSCKKKDSESPEIEILSPKPYAVYDVGDTVHVEAEISDDNQLKHAQLYLLKKTGKVVMDNFNFPINGDNYHLSKLYPLKDSLLESGDYYFQIIVSDGNNVSNNYVYIKINGIPLETRNYFFVLQNSGNTFINKVTSGFSQSLFTSMQGDFSDATVNSYNQQIVVAGAYTGGLLGIDARNATLIWQKPNKGGAIHPYFNQLVYDQNEHNVYVSIREGIIRRYEPFGGNSGSFRSYKGYYPNHFCLGDTFLVTAERRVGVNDIKLGTYYKASGGNQRTKTIYDLDSIQKMFMLPGAKAYCFGNKAGAGEIYLYDVIPHSGNIVKHLPTGQIQDACLYTGNTFLIATNNEILEFDPKLNSLTTILQVDANHIKYDKVKHRIILSRGNQFEVYDANDGSLLYNTTASSTIKNLLVLYNK